MAITKVNNAMQDALAAAQPTITSVGTLTGLDVAGTATMPRLGLGVAAHASAALHITTTDQHIRFNNGSELGTIYLDSDGELNIWAHGDGETINLKTGSGSGNNVLSVVGNNVGIGSSPVSWSGGMRALELKGYSGTTKQGSIAFDSHSGANGYNLISTDTGNMLFYNGTTNRASAVETLKIQTTGNVTVSNGNLVIGTSGKGIDFSANGNAGGMTSEVLSDYETGTFTAQLNGGTTPSTPLVTTGSYTKIGNTVTFSFAFENQDTTGYAGHLSFSGLPFGSASSTVARTPVQVMTYLGATIGSAAKSVQGNITSGGSTTIYVYSDRSQNAYETVTHNARNTVYFWVGGTYLAA